MVTFKVFLQNGQHRSVVTEIDAEDEAAAIARFVKIHKISELYDAYSNQLDGEFDIMCEPYIIDGKKINE